MENMWQKELKKDFFCRVMSRIEESMKWFTSAIQKMILRSGNMVSLNHAESLKQPEKNGAGKICSIWFPLVLPANRVTDYIVKCDSIYAKDSVYLKEYLNPSTVAKKMAETSIIYHKVKSGETLGGIANRYRVTIKQLMRWNGIKNANTLRVGQRLRIER